MVREKTKKTAKTKSPSKKNILEGEMIKYYSKKNSQQERIERNRDENEKSALLKGIGATAIALIASLLLFYIIYSKISSLNIMLKALMFLFILIACNILSQYIFLRDEDNFKFWMQIFVQGIVVVFLMFGQFMILSEQVKIQAGQLDMMDVQTKILDRTTQSNKADLILMPIKEDRYYSYRLEELDEPGERESIYVGIINQGKTIAPFATIKISDKRFIGKEREKQESKWGNWEIKGLPSLNYTSTSFWIQTDYYDEENYIAKENLSLGKYNVTFSIDCPYCEEPYKEENITICIFSQPDGEIEEDCGEGWEL